MQERKIFDVENVRLCRIRGRGDPSIRRVPPDLLDKPTARMRGAMDSHDVSAYNQYRKESGVN